MHLRGTFNLYRICTTFEIFSYGLQGDPFHFQILGMQDALMDITEEIGRIFHRERLAAKIIHAPDSATRASLIARMGPENRVELIRMAKSLQLFRWLLIQVTT